MSDVTKLTDGITEPMSADEIAEFLKWKQDCDDIRDNRLINAKVRELATREKAEYEVALEAAKEANFEAHAAWGELPKIRTKRVDFDRTKRKWGSTDLKEGVTYLYLQKYGDGGTRWCIGKATYQKSWYSEYWTFSGTYSHNCNAEYMLQIHEICGLPNILNYLVDMPKKPASLISAEEEDDRDE